MAAATEGEPVALPVGVDLCAYRIVQEGLTNALKHAGPARAEVVLRYAPRSLEVAVLDDGRGPAAANGEGTGHGLIGMRERVALYGGRLQTGPRPGRRLRGPRPPAAAMSTRVLIADDQALVRAGFRKLLESAPGIEVVGEAADGRAAVDEARRLRPALVLMDIRMPRLDGIEATRRLTADGDSARVLILTTFGLDDYVYDALRAGASDFMLKDAPPEELLAAIEVVARGDALIAPAVTRSVIEEFVRRSPAPRPPPPVLDELTAREGEVLALLARGLSNAEIAERLVVSDGTVKTHVAHVLGKLGLRDRVQAVILAYEAGRGAGRARLRATLPATWPIDGHRASAGSRT